MVLSKIISGGQTGVDRAVLDVCLKLNFPYDGYCPKGRIAEDGVLNSKYLLKETSTSLYSERTIKNIIISDATLVFIPDENVLPEDGTKLTIEVLKETKKPFLLISIKWHPTIVARKIKDFLKDGDVKILNVAGPRSSQCELAYSYTHKILTKILTK